MGEQQIKKDIKLITVGMGIVIYSNKAVENIQAGEDFFVKEFSTPQKVSRHIKKGDIIGFNTGSVLVNLIIILISKIKPPNYVVYNPINHI